MTGAEQRAARPATAALPAAAALPATAALPAAVAIVPMRWWHIAGVLELERELFPEEPWSEATFWSELTQADTRHYVVAVRAGSAPAAQTAPAQDERVVGYAGLAAFGAEAHVLTLGVTRDAQRRGVGTALLQDLLAEAARQRASTVLLDVRADNPAAQRLYVRHGFAPIGVRKRYYQPSGTDAVVMARHG
jgi:[ribosomal protein S18]-alanine N-acetyltransferase